MSLRLGVNIDHVATLRNARGGTHPDPVEVALAAIEAGADGITLHLREDRRHIRDEDLALMSAAISKPINLEMAATDEMLAIACGVKPHAACIVPERRTEVTTEGGLDVAGQQARLGPMIARLSAAGIRVSLFIDPDPVQIRAAAALGAPVIELHTGAYAHGRAGELERLQTGAHLAAELGLECHAGHGLTFQNVTPIAAMAQVKELNIGHFLIGEAILIGLPAAIRQMRSLMDKARS